MGLRIATNIQSLSAQRNLGINIANQSNSLQKLSSGSRITKSADDAGGLAISEKMKSQIRSLNQDVRNANDGISLIQTAEGGMSEVGNILTRFRELSIQAASDTVGEVERGFIDKEVQQMKEEISRITASTEFNGRKLLSGEGDVLSIQVGTKNNPNEDRFSFDVKKVDVSLEKLGLHDIAVQTREQARDNLEKIDSGFRMLSDNRSELGALQNRLQSAINNLNIYTENLSTANSRIRDTDVAAESAELAKNNILAQSTISVLSQANQNNLVALKLLG